MEVQTVGIVGLGTMGAGIAQVCVQAGVETVGREVSADLAERGRATIERHLARGVEKSRLTQEDMDAALGRLRLTTELAAATSHPQRVVGMHFFNPAPVLPLVEVVRTELTDPAVHDAAYDFATRIGKEPIRCSDTPGFVVNRVLIPLLNDCVRVLDEARVTPEDLDTGMKDGAGWPMGPCELLDLVGIDVHVHASEALWGALREPRIAPPPRLVRMAEAGLLGRKTGRGFFEY